MIQIGHGPSQIITPNLNVGEQKMMKNCSNGNTDVMINGREVTKAEKLMLKVILRYSYTSIRQRLHLIQ